MLKSVIYLLVAVQIAHSDPAGVATYRCNSDQTIQFTYPQATPVVFTRLVVASDIANSPTSPCQVTGNTGGGSLSTTIDALTECGLTVTAGSVTVKFFLTEADSIVTTQDYEYTVVCDFNQPSTQDESVTFSAITGVPPAATNAIVKTETVTLDVVNTGDETAAVPTCTLADTNMLKLRLTLTTSATAFGVRAITCTASPDNSGSPSVDIITASCGSGFVGTTITTGFKKSPGTSSSGQSSDDTNVAAATYVSIMTSGFNCFRFNTPATLYMTCAVAFCTDNTGDEVCDGSASQNTCGTKPATITKRKRRATNTTSDTETEIFSVTINVGSEPSDAGKSGKSGSNGVRHAGAENCDGFMHNTTFITVVSILALLLLFVLGVTVYVCVKVKVMHANPVKGLDNSAF